MHPPRVPRVLPFAREAGVTDVVNVNEVAWQDGWGAAFRKQITGEVEGEERALIREKKQAVEAKLNDIAASQAPKTEPKPAEQKAEPTESTAGETDKLTPRTQKKEDKKAKVKEEKMEQKKAEAKAAKAAAKQAETASAPTA